MCQRTYEKSTITFVYEFGAKTHVCAYKTAKKRNGLCIFISPENAKHCKMNEPVLCIYLIFTQLVCIENIFISQNLNKEISSGAKSKFWDSYIRALLQSKHQFLAYYQPNKPKNIIHNFQAFAKKVSKYTKANKWSGGAVKWKRIIPDLQDMYMAK